MLVSERPVWTRFGHMSFPLLVLLFLFLPVSVLAQISVPDAVLDTFDEHCAFSGCHAGPASARGLDLTEGFVASSLINQPSREKSSIMRVQPGDPVNSYLIMKLKGASGISGEQMPKGADPLGPSEIAAIESWIRSLPATTVKPSAPQREYAEAFPGMSLATLPTTQTLERGFFSYRIAHRWQGPVKNGFDEFFGLDAGAHMFTQLDFAVTNDFTFTVARSGQNATFEFAGKWRILREKSDGSTPVSMALRAGLDWETFKQIPDPAQPSGSEFLSRTDGQRFHWFFQGSLSKQLHDRISVLLVPGILFNGNVGISDEDAIFSLGWVAKLMLAKDFSFFVEGVPILSGSSGAATIGGPRVEGGEEVINDAFTIGLERRVGGHVFHVYVTNSLGLATNQYMSGGNFDFADGDFRLGFNIYRTLRFPF